MPAVYKCCEGFDLISQFSNVIYLTFNLLNHYNHKYFCQFEPVQNYSMLQYPFRNALHTFSLRTCKDFVLTRKADVLLASSHHPSGSSSHQKGASWTQAEGKHGGRGCVYTGVCDWTCKSPLVHRAGNSCRQDFLFYTGNKMAENGRPGTMLWNSATTQVREWGACESECRKVSRTHPRTTCWNICATMGLM